MRNIWEWLGLCYLQPLVDTLGMELVVAGEDSEQLPCLKVTEADDTPGRAQSVTQERLITEYEATPQEGIPLQPICAQRAGDGSWHSQCLL